MAATRTRRLPPIGAWTLNLEGCVQTPLHEALIDRLKAQGARTTRFRSEVLKFLEGTFGWSPEYADEIEIARCVPDAYRLEPARGSRLAKIVVWEVEVTHPLPQRKLDSYARFWSELDASDVHAVLEVHVVDRHGFNRPANLVAHHYASVLKMYGIDRHAADIAQELQFTA